MTTKNETQLNFLYGEEVTEVLKESIKTAIKNGNCVTIDIESVDDFDNRHFAIAKFKLWFKKQKEAIKYTLLAILITLVFAYVSKVCNAKHEECEWVSCNCKDNPYSYHCTVHGHECYKDS